MSSSHSNTVSAAPSVNGGQAPNNRNTRLNQLLAQRDLLETEAEAIAYELRSPGPNGEPPAGIKDPLVDKEGFPRGDIDLYRVRTLRGRLAVINTDHKILMKDIDQEVRGLHQTAEANSGNKVASIERVSTELSVSDTSMMGEADFSTEMRRQEIQQQYGLYPVIATVDQVLPQSPAATAALVDGMELLQFGSISCISCGGSASAALQAVPEAVRSAFYSGQSIRLIVRCISSRTDSANTNVESDSRLQIEIGTTAVPSRSATDNRETQAAQEIRVIFIKPQVWAGRGLLGMHLTPQ